MSCYFWALSKTSVGYLKAETMTGNKSFLRKVTGKKHQRLIPRKIDLKKEKEKVKLLGGLVAQMRAVQAELTQRMDNSLLNPEWNTNPQGLQITAGQLRKFNILGSQLNSTVQDYIEDLLGVLDKGQ